MAADAKAKTATKKRITTPAKKKKAATAIDSPFRNFTPYKPKRNEEYMSEGQLAHLREMLVKERLTSHQAHTINILKSRCILANTLD